MEASKKQTAWKAFRQMWIAGTVGGFFAALMRSVPLDLKDWSGPADYLYTFDLFIRYGYLLWLIGYFFVSNHLVDNKPERFDVFYEVLQSICSFVAAFALGFVVRNEGFPYGASAWAFDIANATIFVICGLALLMFWDSDWNINLLRGIGALLALVSMWLPTKGVMALPPLLELAVLQLGLWVLLFLYGRLRINAMQASQCRTVA